MYNDPIIEEIHKYREEHGAKFNFDIKKIVAYYQKKQKANKDRIVNLSTKKDEIPTEV